MSDKKEEAVNFDGCCKNCHWWYVRKKVQGVKDVIVDSGGHETGNCKRFPPVYVVAMQMSQLGIGSNVQMMNPITIDADYCGEFKQREQQSQLGTTQSMPLPKLVK